MVKGGVGGHFGGCVRGSIGGAEETAEVRVKYSDRNLNSFSKLYNVLNKIKDLKFPF